MSGRVVSGALLLTAKKTISRQHLDSSLKFLYNILKYVASQEGLKETE